MAYFMYGAATITFAAGMVSAAQMDPSIAMVFLLGLFLSLGGLLVHYLDLN